MDDIKSTVPIYDADDGHIVRRLGWAVVKQWQNLPEWARERIKQQAVFVHDSDVNVQLEQLIGAFIEKHKGGP